MDSSLLKGDDKKSDDLLEGEEGLRKSLRIRKRTPVGPGELGGINTSDNQSKPKLALDMEKIH